MNIKTTIVTVEQARKFWDEISWFSIKDGVKIQYRESDGRVDLSYDADCEEHQLVLAGL